MKKLYALIGYPLEHSFSKTFFEKKFLKEKIIDAEFANFEMENLSGLRKWIDDYPHLQGFMVTIPHKETIIPFLDKISDIATEVGAVNVVKIVRNKENIQLLGHNTDVFGFEKAFLEKTLCNSVFSPCFSVKPKNKISALLLGTGGAAKAIAYVLKKLNIEYQLVTRNPKNNAITYEVLNKQIIQDNLLIINATPLGMFPNINTCPPIDYTAIGKNHFLFDLVYNPAETLFMKKGKAHGAVVQNGYEMLVYQAEEGWMVWNNF